jgi:integrase
VSARSRSSGTDSTRHSNCCSKSATLCRSGTSNRRSHLSNLRSVSGELNVWCDLVGTLSRHAITKDHVLDARAQWLEEGLAPKTVNHRVNRLRALFRELDGPRALSPTDDVRPLPVPRTPIQRITPQVVLDVIDRMATSRFKTRLRKPIARLLVYATTGRRPSEIARALRSDVDFENRIWIPRDGKGGYTPGIYLNDDMLFAWRFFDEAKAWGRFNTRVFPRTLRRYGWPEGVRPYNLRHTIGITLSEGGFDLADVGPQLGHKQLETTRRHYVPVLDSRMQRMSEALNGRFALPVPQPRSTKPEKACPHAPEVPDEKRLNTEGKSRRNC